MAPGMSYCITVKLNRQARSADSSVSAQMWILFTFSPHDEHMRARESLESATAPHFIVGRRASYSLTSRPEEFASMRLSVEAGANCCCCLASSTFLALTTSTLGGIFASSSGTHLNRTCSLISNHNNGPLRRSTHRRSIHTGKPTSSL